MNMWESVATACCPAKGELLHPIKRKTLGVTGGLPLWLPPAEMKRLLIALVVTWGLTGLLAARAEEKGASAATKKEQTTVNTNEVAVVKTAKGEMVIEFWPDVAPNTVENFKKLAKQGFYDGTCFHRIIKGFMIQGGDPLTKDASMEARWGTGDPGYKIKAEFNKKSHQFGVISMARSSNPDSAGSQFFICHGDASFLDGQYTAFGHVIKGEDVLKALGEVPTRPGGGGERSKPSERQGVESIKIVDRTTLK
jgi:peptidyl-prolyl cis-trans isomerase B (cyclophilin B)